MLKPNGPATKSALEAATKLLEHFSEVILRFPQDIEL